jgi:MFS family permease
MPKPQIKLYSARWVVLSLFMMANLVVQVLWICYAPVASLAASTYGVSRESVDLLANLFMLVYIPVAFPAAWAIDTFGFKKAVGFGTVMVGVFGLLRAVFPTSYAAALVGSVGLAIGQPFLLNAFSKCAADWFPKRQRATIIGVVFLASFAGIGLGESVSPALVGALGFGGMQMVYGIAAAGVAVLFVTLARAKPPTPASPPGEDTRALVLDGLKMILKNKSIWLLSFTLLIGGAIVNGLFILVDGIVQEKSLTVSQGVLLTSLLLLGCIVGSVVVPIVSDGLKRRKLVIQTAALLVVPCTLGIVLGGGMGIEMACFFAMGFFVTGVTPVAYQYGAELTHPAPEGTSNGILALVVQASGLLIVLMDVLRGPFGNSYIPSFVGLAALLFVSVIGLFAMKESPEMLRRIAAGRKE